MTDQSTIEIWKVRLQNEQALTERVNQLHSELLEKYQIALVEIEELKQQLSFESAKVVEANDEPT